MQFEGNISSKIPSVDKSIFAQMSEMAARHDSINLSQGFPNFSCHPKLISLVSQYMEKGFNQYAPMEGVPVLRERIAEKIESIHGAKYNVEKEITITGGATQAIQIAMTAFLNEDDEVIVFEPSYDSYLPCINLNKAKPVYYKMEAPDYTIDWKQVMKLINQRTKMILINSPHNPTGHILTAEDLTKLQRLLDGTDIIVLSDEVYEHIVYDEEGHQSASRFKELRKRSLIVSSFGKTFHTTGWKLGYIVGPENLMKEFRKVFQFAQFSVSTPMQWALSDFLLEKDHYLELANFYKTKRDLFATYLDQSRFKSLECRGTYFQVVDYSSISKMSDKRYVSRLSKEHGVASIPISAFYKNGDDHKIIRFCFAKSEETLHKAGELLCKI